MIKRRNKPSIQIPTSKDYNEFLFEHNKVEFQPSKYKGRLSMKNNFQKEKLLNNLPHTQNIAYKIRTESNERFRPKQLPDLTTKNTLEKLKKQGDEKGGKIVRGRCKNSHILNELIGILQDDAEEFPKFNQIKMKPVKLRGKQTQLVRRNQFLEEKEGNTISSIPQRGPKVIPTEIMKIFDSKSIVKRNIYSEDRSRLPKGIGEREMKKMPTQSEDFVTFYNMKQRVHTEAVKFKNKGILLNSQFDF